MLTRRINILINIWFKRACSLIFNGIEASGGALQLTQHLYLTKDDCCNQTFLQTQKRDLLLSSSFIYLIGREKVCVSIDILVNQRIL